MSTIDRSIDRSNERKLSLSLPHALKTMFYGWSPLSMNERTNDLSPVHLAELYYQQAHGDGDESNRIVPIHEEWEPTIQQSFSLGTTRAKSGDRTDTCFDGALEQETTAEHCHKRQQRTTTTTQRDTTHRRAMDEWSNERNCHGTNPNCFLRWMVPLPMNKRSLPGSLSYQATNGEIDGSFIH